MASTWQTVRVFISSTFRDMHVERDHLVKVVLRALREGLEKHLKPPAGDCYSCGYGGLKTNGRSN